MNYNSIAKIISYTDGAKICARAASLSTTKGNTLDLFEREKPGAEDAVLLEKVVASGHNSVIEHAVFTVAFCNVSALVEQFIIEFRLQSLTIKSRRYVNYEDMGFYTPGYFSPEHTARYKRHMEYLFGEYAFLLKAGVPREDARFILPYSFYSNFYCTINARELLYIIREIKYGRGKNYAELQELARQLSEQLEKIIPGLKPALNAPAVKGESAPLTPKRSETVSPEPTVKLVSATPCMDRVVLTGHLAANHYPLEELEERLSGPNKAGDMLKAIAMRKRARELEQVTLTFLIGGISLAGITHFVRHRMQSIIVPPMAYVNSKRYLTPATVLENPSLLERYNAAFAKTAALYANLSAEGYNVFELSYLALSGNLFDIMTTMNAREFRLFTRLRTCNRAQWEIRGIASDMLSLARKESPELFSLFGPSCFMDGVCPEGRLSCGKINEVKAFYSRST